MGMNKFKTWEEECLPLLRVLNDSGDVAVCALWNLIDVVMLGIKSDRVSVVGNLRTPLGISWFLRGLGMFPNIRTVVIWGSDLTRVGEAILQLWKQGIEDHLIPVFQWKIDLLVENWFIENVRRDVQLIDLRGRGLGEIEGIINNIPLFNSQRSKIIFPPVPIAERSVLSPRSAPIFIRASSPKDGWLQLLNGVMRCGTVKTTRKKEKIANYFEIVVSFPAPEEEVIDECFDFTKNDLDAYYDSFLSSDPPPEGIDYRYGQRIQNWRGHNQLQEVIERLRENLDTKRGTISLLDACDLNELEDAPCLIDITFAVVDGKLNMSCIYRSHDMYGGWPSNIFALLRLYRSTAEQLKDKGVAYGRFTVISQNAQIYERHFSLAEEKLNKYWITLESVNSLVKFEPDPVGAFVFSLDEKTRMVKVTMKNCFGDANLFEVEHKSPSALIKWIISTMPWLDHQHIGYLGKQEAKLLLALENKVPYRQD